MGPNNIAKVEVVDKTTYFFTNLKNVKFPLNGFFFSSGFRPLQAPTLMCTYSYTHTHIILKAVVGVRGANSL